MSVLSEEGIRKIVRESISKRSIQEGLFDNVRSQPGRVEYKRCDLSAFRNHKFAVKFAKHFLYDPKVKITDTEGITKTITKKNLLSFVLGTGLSDIDDKLYEEDIRRQLRDKPEIINNFIDILETGITFFLGTRSQYYCKLLSIVFASDAKPVERDAEPVERLERTSINALTEFKKAMNESISKFVIEYDVSDLVKIESDASYLFLFPSTTISVLKGDKEEALEIFKKEKSRWRLLLEKDLKVSRIIDFVNIELYDNIKGKRRFIYPIINFLKSMPDDYNNAEKIAKYLIDMKEKSVIFFEDVVF